MTLPSGVASRPPLPGRYNPDHQSVEHAEAVGVSDTVALGNAMRPIGGQRLMLAQINWAKLQPEAPEQVIEAVPSVAKATLTRDSRRRWELARKARREASALNPLFALQKAIAGRKGR